MHRLAAELHQSERDEEDVEGDQADQDGGERQGGELRNERGAAAPARIPQGGEVQPKKIMGASTRLNIRPICPCPTEHPSVKPIEEESRATRRHRAANRKGWGSESATPRPITSQAPGNTIRPATSAWIIPARIFSTATHSISMGARRRSSISRVN